MIDSYLLVVILLLVSLLDAHKWPGRPSVFQKPEFARYVTKNAEWGIVSAYSPMYEQPFGTLQSFADGGTGVPYFYISQWSTTWKNIVFNNTVSFTMSEAESEYCEGKGLDPMEPVCGRIMLTGHILPVVDREELDFARSAVFTKHPAMKKWPGTHQWTFMKLNLTSVNVLSYYGGISHVSLSDYFNVKA